MVLTYHEILPQPSPYAYSVTSGVFREHLEFLSMVRAQRKIALPAITFDDGHASHCRLAMPVLEEYQFRGIFFVTAGWIQNRPSYMSWAELAKLADLGHEVQSHSWSHRLLTGCTTDELMRELSLSKNVLEQKLGRKVNAVSMPGGRWNQRVALACAAVGYERVYTSDPWLGPVEKCGAVHTGRWMVRRTTRVKDLRRLLENERRPFHPIRLQHSLKQFIKTIAGDRLYQRAWELFSAKSALRQSEVDFDNQHPWNAS